MEGNTKDDFWRKTINNISTPMPEVGISAPEEEIIKPKTRTRKTINNKDRKVNVQKIITTIYVFTDTRDKVYTSHVSTATHLLGEMTLEQGMHLAKGEQQENGGSQETTR